MQEAPSTTSREEREREHQDHHRVLEQNGGNQRTGSPTAAIDNTQDAAPHGLVIVNAPAGGQITLLSTPASLSQSELQQEEGFGGVFPRRVVSVPPVSYLRMHASSIMPVSPLVVEREADGGNPVAS